MTTPTTPRYVKIDGDPSDDPTTDFASNGLGAIYDTETHEVYPFGSIAEDATRSFNEGTVPIFLFDSRPATDLEREQLAEAVAA
jgi:hypothetical protein